MGWCFQISIDKTNTVKLCDKKPLDSEQLGNREPFPVINLLVYFMIRVQPGISEQFCHDQKFPYHQVWLYKIRISMQYRVRTKQLVNSKVRFFYLNITLMHGLRTPREKIAFTAWPKIQSQSQIFWYGQSIFCLPHRPNFSDIFNLCLHWVSVVCVCTYWN